MLLRMPSDDLVRLIFPYISGDRRRLVRFGRGAALDGLESITAALGSASRPG